MPKKYHKNLDEYIYLVEDILSDNLCDEIINEYGNDEYYVCKVGSNEVKENVRKVNAVGISDEQTINKNYNKRKNIDNSIFEASSKAIQEYHKKYPNVSIQQDTGYEVLKYETGDFYKEHTDSFKEEQRSISCSFALNDNFEGGNFGFFNREKLIKVPKGSALMFPSNFMYPHEITPVTSGTRYSIITWFV